MNDLIHRIVEIIIEAGQSDTKKFRLGETIRYSPSEILEILKQHENEIFGEESSTQANTSNTLNALDCISRQTAIDDIETVNPSMPLSVNWVKNWIKTLPSARPEIMQKDVELYCRRRCLTLITNELFNEIKVRWSAQQEPIKGKWLERSVDVDGKKSIEEWQSAKCSVCGRYHTTPFLYYFDDFNFCPNCGAKMEI